MNNMQNPHDSAKYQASQISQLLKISETFPILDLGEFDADKVII